MVRNVVLVHGAWHGAWCWEQVVPRMTELGLRAVAVDLPGRGADPGPLTDLHGDAARVTEVLDGLDEPAVLVGHSYGGAVITEAGDHPTVERLVFIAALPLDTGESCAEAAVEESTAAGINWEGRPNLAEGFIVAPDNTVRLDPRVAAQCLYNQCDADTVRRALGRLDPHPLGNLQQTPSVIAWRTKTSTYVVCADDFGVHPDLQRVLAKRCSSVVEWPTDHSPFFSDPPLVVRLLADVAADS